MFKRRRLITDILNPFMYNTCMNRQTIQHLLTTTFSPTHLMVIDESDQHQGHRGTPNTENTHFHVIVVSDAFDGQSLVMRHRQVNKALKDGFQGPLHALKITAKTPTEWGHP